MTTYAPAGFGPQSNIGPHQGLRVTFAYDRSMFVPDAIEASVFRNAVENLIGSVDEGGYPVVPASAVAVAPDETATTIDFAVVGSGSVNVGQAVTQLSNGLYGILFGLLGDEALRSIKIRDVALIGSEPGAIPWGVSIPRPAATPQGSWLAAGGALTAVAVAAGVVFFAPELKALLRAKRAAS